MQQLYNSFLSIKLLDGHKSVLIILFVFSKRLLTQLLAQVCIFIC
jgi:hypothetical protein